LDSRVGSERDQLPKLGSVRSRSYRRRRKRLAVTEDALRWEIERENDRLRQMALTARSRRM